MLPIRLSLENYKCNLSPSMTRCAGFCQITCGRCDCCRTLRNVATDEGLSELVWAFEISGLGNLLNAPGWEVAILGPRNGALQRLLDSLGFTVQDVESNSKWARVLGEALKFSVLKADPDLRAVYTEAFLHDGMELATEFDDHQRLKVQKDGGGTVKFVGPMGSATVLEWDKPSCKGYIHIVDEYLVPSADFGTYLEDVTDVGETEGYCETATSKQYDGQLVDTKQTQSPGDCCRKCKKNKDCTVWTFCAKPSGCQERNSPIIPWGTCHLLFDVALTQGRNPTTIRSDELTPYHSGVFRR
ncbi:unnamed protein product [Ostreobium quekettii]|uniref:FAS1 domain-containing protein n=1 Tax=Ostreobium quekettii TaxID=121088 RepID=A0A8S1ILT7_9CHLO|nr:unnamed protein product [Ostreobium quekettii]